jgi:phosphatidylserine synthase
MAHIPASALGTKSKKHFIGIPAPLGYVAGVGRGLVSLSLLWANFVNFFLFIFQRHRFHHTI